MLNKYFYKLAQRAADISALPAEWIYCQWVHETAGFTSDLCLNYHNLGGITTDNPNEVELELGQPDGSLWYKVFSSYEHYAEYFGKYLKLYEEDGIYEATDIQSYAEALKNGGYFGDTVENYVEGMTSAYEDAFSED